jgi:hypothetical protein
VLLVRATEGASSISQIDARDAKDLRILLSEVGARLEDVFGFENILWVEGKTEEICFPMILTALLGRPLARLGIIGLVSTGDLEARHKQLAFQVYQRLAEASVLMPPTVAFVFDTEQRSEAHRQEIIRSAAGRAKFLPRRMFENYLLDPNAIAAVASAEPGFGNVTASDVEMWLDGEGLQEPLFRPHKPPLLRTDAEWLDTVSGAKLLDRLFTALSDARVSYDKVKHGVALTEWLLQNNPGVLRPLATFLDGVLQES